MKYPGYLLNPGDLFQVDPDRVLFATGRPKGENFVEEIVDEEAEGEDDAAEEVEDQPTDTQEDELPDDEKDPRKILKQLAAQSKAILAAPESLSAKRKQDLRAFQKSVKKTLSRPSSSELQTDSLEVQFAELKALVDKRNDMSRNQEDPPSSDQKEASPSSQPAPILSEDAELRSIRSALNILHGNPVNENKSYATPWQPRDYMSAFAFIPRYLEVNQNICAAVYLRHPVARPGLAEVPTPFSDYVNSSAFAWYLRRR